MTASELAHVGQALFGEAWKQQLADVLEVSLHTVQNWARGRSRIPPGVPPDLAVICRDKGAALTRIAHALDAGLFEL